MTCPKDVGRMREREVEVMVALGHSGIKIHVHL
jgi:hypothetical protein